MMQKAAVYIFTKTKKVIFPLIPSLLWIPAHFRKIFLIPEEYNKIFFFCLFILESKQKNI